MTVDAAHSTDARSEATRVWPAWLLLAALFLLLVGPVIVSGRGGSSEAADQDRHHLVVIDRMIEQWPDVDLVHYPSATSPGYYYAMAALGVAVGDAQRARPLMRWANALLSLGLLTCVLVGCAMHIAPRRALLLTLPALLSKYTLAAAMWLTTDNAALAFVCLAMLALLRPVWSSALGGVAGLAGVAAVVVRQIHVWVAAPIGFAGLLASPLAAWVPAAVRAEALGPKRWSALAIGAIGAGATLAAVAVFVRMWGGLMPPAYTDIHNTGWNPATFAFALALLGGFGVFLLPLVVDDLRAALRDRLVWAGAAVGLLAATVVPTAYSDRDRAYGAVWRVVRVAPEVMDRSLLILGAAALGGAVLAALHRGCQRRGQGGRAGAVMLASAGWMLAQSFNSMAWQRYFEPMVLILLAWLVAMGAREAARRGWRPWAGVALLSLAQLVVSLASTYREALTAGG